MLDQFKAPGSRVAWNDEGFVAGCEVDLSMCDILGPVTC